MRAALAALLLAACASTQVVDRADDGTAILIRGRQPTADSLAALDRLEGVTTVVNLRGAAPGAAWFEEERRGVEAIGAAWVQLDVSGHVPPPPETLARFFDLVEDPARWPVLVHCQSGMHRTGLLAAIYRRQYQGWSADEAWAEMKRNGFTAGGADRQAAIRFVREYVPDPARRIDRKPSRRAREGGTLDGR